MKQIESVDALMWIDGQDAGADLPRRKVVSPVDGAVLGTYPLGRAEDAAAAVAAAKRARKAWAATTIFERAG